MDLSDYIGVVVSVVFMLFIFIKKANEERSRRKNPQLYAQQQQRKQQALKDFYASLEHEADEDELEEDLDADERPLQRVRSNLAPSKSKLKPPPMPAPVQRPPQKAFQHQNDAHTAHHFAYSYGQQSTKAPGDKFGDAPAYEVIRDRKDSRGGRLIHKLASRRDMLIFREIFDKPLALRDLPDVQENHRE